MSEQPRQAAQATAGVARLVERIPPKLRGVVPGVIAVALLAGVILVVSALSAPKSTPPPKTGLGTTTSTDVTYQRAQLALQSGETTAAIALLEKVVAADPSNQQARRTLQAARATQANSSGGTTSGNGTTTKPAPKAEDPAFSKPTADLGVLLPSMVEGYSLGAQSALGDDATVSGTPSGSNVAGSRAQWSVHYRKSGKEAAKFVAKVSKELYPKNAKTLQIDGSPAYFGTDGTRFATVVYVRGRYVFEVVLSTLDGKPSRLSVEAEKAAKAFPDTL